MANMVITFSDEAWENFQDTLNTMNEYGVTISRDGFSFDAILIAPTRFGDADVIEDGAVVSYIPVRGDNWFRDAYTDADIETNLVDKIEVH